MEPDWPKMKRVKTESNKWVDTFYVYDDTGAFMYAERELNFQGLWKVYVDDGVISIYGIYRKDIFGEV